MKTKIIGSILITLLSINTALAQRNVSDRSREEISRLSFFVGEWSGTGLAFSQQGTESFNVVETISYAVDSTILLVEGIGTHSETGEKRHHALAMIYFDHDNEKFRLHSFIMTGSNTIATVELTGERSFKWYFDTPNGGQVTFYAEFTEDSWTERGEYTSPEGTSYPTIQMKLKRES